MNSAPKFTEETGGPFAGGPFAGRPSARPAPPTATAPPHAAASSAPVALDDGLTLQLADHSYIHGQRIRNPSGALTHITIGKFCSIATHLTVIGYDHHSEWISMYPFLDDGNRALWPGTAGIPYPQEPRFGSNKSRGDIVIGNDVWIGYDVKLFKGITIGNGAVIGACSLVNKSVEPYTIVAGIPARPIRKRFSDREIAALEKMKWWDWPADRINRFMPQLCSSNILELEKQLEQNPDFFQGASVRSEECLARADAAYARNDLKSAADALTEALRFNPGSTPLLVCLGNIQFQLADYAAALSTFKSADEKKPNDGDILVRLANAASRCNEPALLDQTLKKALELDPKNPHALRLTANQNLNRGRYADAAAQYCSLVASQSQDVLLWLQLGKCLHGLNDSASSRFCYQRVLQLEPANAIAHEALLGLNPQTRSAFRSNASPTGSRS